MWWDRQERTLSIYLQSHMCDEHRSEFLDDDGQGETLDWINPETGEVEQLDGMRYALRAHCCQQDGYLTQRISLVDAIFRVFLCNGNQPMTPRELALQIGRVGQESLILRTLSGQRVYEGLRPVAEQF